MRAAHEAEQAARRLEAEQRAAAELAAREAALEAAGGVVWRGRLVVGDVEEVGASQGVAR